MAMELKCSSTKLVFHICPIFHYVSSRLLPSCPVMIYFQLWMFWMRMVMKGDVFASPISESPLIISYFLFEVKFLVATALVCMLIL